MTDSARDMVGALEGRVLWDATRAVDMEMFQFGERVTQEFRGKTRTVGEYALHIVSAWRIVCEGRVLVGYRDHWTPPDGISFEDFDPDKMKSRRDELLASFLTHGEEAHRVETAALSENLDLSLRFADACVLNAFADIGYQEVVGDEAPNECWRLFQPGEDGPHFVVWAGGVTD